MGSCVSVHKDQESTVRLLFPIGSKREGFNIISGQGEDQCRSHLSPTRFVDADSINKGHSQDEASLGKESIAKSPILIWEDAAIPHSDDTPAIMGAGVTSGASEDVFLIFMDISSSKTENGFLPIGLNQSFKKLPSWEHIRKWEKNGAI